MFEELRKNLKDLGLTWAVIELIIANVVVGNQSQASALELGTSLAQLSVCAFEGCDKPSTTLAAALQGPPARYCDEHADIVAKEWSPEYDVVCPHCGCEFGVG